MISITDQTLSNQGSKNLFNPKSSAQKNYYLQDELGSPIRLVDSKGKTTERYSYDEFGTPNGLKMALGLSKSSNPFGFTGYPYDPSTGLHFAQARYYAAGVGRFISEDAYKGVITNPLSLNLYTYVYNNPLKHIDPSGNDAIIVTAKEAAGGFGHTSALFQDGKNDWFYTYWGNKGVVVEKVNVNSLKGLNNWIKSQEFSDWSTKGYTSSTYVAGDFTQSLQFFKDKRDNFNGIMEEKNKDYSLFFNNCLQVTSEALSLGVLNDGTSVKHFVPDMTIPNSAKFYFEDRFYNNAFTLDEYTKQLKNKLDEYDNSREYKMSDVKYNTSILIKYPASPYYPTPSNREVYKKEISEINSLLSK